MMVVNARSVITRKLRGFLLVWLIRRVIKGLGDAVMLEPLVSILWEHIGINDEIWVQTLDWIAPIFHHHPKIDKVLSQHENIKTFRSVRMVLDIQSSGECPCAAYESEADISKSRQQIHVESALGGFFLYDGRGARLYLSNLEGHDVEQFNKYTHGIKIGFQVRSAEQWRDYPHMEMLIRLLRRKTNWSLFLFDKDAVPNINGTVPIVNFPIREVMWRIKAMDLFIGPDSGLVHIAAALGVKTYAIFGPTCPSIRLGSYGEHVSWNKDFALCKHSRCWYTSCSKIWCLRLLSPRKVFKDIKKNVCGREQ